MNDAEYALLSKTVLKLLGIDLSNYKTQQMRRRLTGLVASNAPSVEDYCRLVQEDRSAFDKLRNFITINVSEFFRDVEQFDILKNGVLPELLELYPRLCIWSAGCSHGGEAYSVAMLLQELTPGKSHSILATDIDETILARASRGGPYSNADVAHVEPKLLLKYFTKTPEGYYVVDSLKRQVRFRKHNLLSDPFEKGFHMVICRNVVIYFSDEAKKALYSRFRDSLKDRGVLFIGATESLLALSELGFDRMRSCFYRKAVTADKSQSAAVIR